MKYEVWSMKYDCNQCENTATHKGNLAGHIQSMHIGVKYECNKCEYRAATQGNLICHI